jgi:hypothetical protein
MAHQDCLHRANAAQWAVHVLGAQALVDAVEHLQQDVDDVDVRSWKPILAAPRALALTRFSVKGRELMTAS